MLFELSYPDTYVSFLTSGRYYGRLSAVLDHERNQSGGFRDVDTWRGGQSGSNGRMCYIGVGHHTRTGGSMGCSIVIVVVMIVFHPVP